MSPRQLRSTKKVVISRSSSVNGGEDEEVAKGQGSGNGNIGKGKAKAKAEGVQTTAKATETHLSTIQGGLDRLVQQLQALRERNDELEDELKAANEIAANRNAQACRNRPTTRRSGSSSDARRVGQLEEQVRKLTVENTKQKNRIKKLEQQAVEHEVEDLQFGGEDAGEDGLIVDKMAKMKKLLRRFADLMVAPTIPTRDTCSICLETLVLKKCSVLKCEHIVCNDCLPHISKGADETVKCAECRKETDREEVGLVHLTEEMWWDEMLKVASAWNAIDNSRTEMETSEEEDEENFNVIGDTSTEISAEDVSSDRDVGEGQGPPAEEETDEEARSSSPPRRATRPRDAVSPHKRKREEDLEDYTAARERRLRKS